MTRQSPHRINVSRGYIKSRISDPQNCHTLNFARGCIDLHQPRLDHVANATLKVLLGSGGVSNEERRKVYSSLVSQHFYSSEKVLFIPFASHDHSEYTTRMNEFLGEDVNLVGIHSFEDPLSALSEFDSIYVGGGNSFLLVNEPSR